MSPTDAHFTESAVPELAPCGSSPARSPPPILSPGETLGGCAIERFIARGGMGELYQARKVSLGCAVAMKVLLPDLVAQESVLTRFEREARVAASLCHPSIVRVYDVGEERGLHYIVMELVHGRDLRDIVRKEGPLPVAIALRTVRQVADALDYAHRRGVIHRDVKPANIVLSPDGVAKLTDLGLARPARQDTEVTVAGEILGTPVYMSPEQFRGDPIDGRSDLYSLGATLYMLLGGAPPFRADTTATLLHKVLNERPPSLKALAPGVPEPVVEIVQRLMAKHPGARFQTGREVVVEIDAALRSRGGVAREPSRSVEAPRRVREPASPRWIRYALATATVTAAIWLVVPSLDSPRSRPRSETRPGSMAEARPGSVILKSEPAKPAASQGKPEPRGSAVPAELKDRLAAFREAIRRRDAEGILECFQPPHRRDPLLRSSLATFLGEVEQAGLEPAFVLPRMTGDSQATANFQLTNDETGRSLSFPTEWVRVEDRWYANPRRSPSQGGPRADGAPGS